MCFLSHVKVQKNSGNGLEIQIVFPSINLRVPCLYTFSSTKYHTVCPLLEVFSSDYGCDLKLASVLDVLMVMLTRPWNEYNRLLHSTFFFFLFNKQVGFGGRRVAEYLKSKMFVAISFRSRILICPNLYYYEFTIQINIIRYNFSKHNNLSLNQKIRCTGDNVRT